jgi:ubiquitin-conjugating enzyme E2 D/E
MALKRLQNEFRNLKTKPIPSCTICPKDDFMEWTAYIKGPTDTPYEGGTFELSIQFPNDYPNRSPIVVFVTKIYHMNIDDSGNICVSLWYKWLPTYTVSTVLLAVFALLGQPNPGNPYPERGKLYEKNEKEYYDKARKWTKTYAMK